MVPRPILSYPARAKRATRGFALLITLTLLSFIVVLLIGLATFTRVETAVAGNTQRQAQARQNALFALNVAVGQLQKHAGPDARVTATALKVPSVNSQKKRYTGVWDTTAVAGTAPVWLASGLEAGTSPDVTTPIPSGSGVALVGINTDGSAAGSGAALGPNNVVAELQTITAPGVPGRTGNATIGKYAWWVGDNGVKADVARPDLATTAKLDYPPFTTPATPAIPATDTAPAVPAVPGVDIPEMRARLYQQTGLGAGAFNTTTSAVVFDPRDSFNLAPATNALTAQQLPFLRTSVTAALGLAQLKSHYHTWTVGNYNVLARTNAAVDAPSLRNDLSTNPGALGAAFAAWADYPSYMEDPVSNPFATAFLPPANAVRRRYLMRPPVTEAGNGSQFSVAPVLTYFALTFSFHNSSTNATDPALHLEANMRCVAEFWNPYTGALKPEDLEIRVTGLPAVSIGDFDRTTPAVPVDLPTVFGDTSLLDPSNPDAPTIAPIRFSLPWPASSIDDQTGSWLPGRVQSWSAADDPDETSTASKIHATLFNFRDLKTTSNGPGVTRNAGAALAITAGASSSLVRRRTFANETTVLTIEVRRASDGAVLATFTSPTFPRFSTDDTVTVTTGQKVLDFAYVFRLGDPVIDGLPWLERNGLDVRSAAPSASATPYVLPGNFVDPASFVVDATATPPTNVDTFLLGNASLLLDRYPGVPGNVVGTSFDEDVPVFELPRAPLLSLGQLQHLAIPALHPFWVGASAAAAGPDAWKNSLFDQHFFSGLGSGTTWSDVSRPLPNTLMQVLRRKADGTAVSPGDFTSEGLAAKYLLQGGAFNLNSTDSEAWAAVLRSVRFPTGREFSYVDADPLAGTGLAGSEATKFTAEAAFPRFSQSAQETYKTTPGYVHTEVGTTVSYTVHTEYYRKGFRTLDAATTAALAQKIAVAVEARIAKSGPFFSVEEFLNPVTSLIDESDPTLGTKTGPSLLEQVIADLGLNTHTITSDDPTVPPVTEDYPMSSIKLTQADLMTVLAPVLFVRSDTFTVRTYGEASNPLTGAAEGRAWCEAIVQRVPEPFAPVTTGLPTDDEYKTPGAGGRRFKVISLRWLTKSDI